MNGPLELLAYIEEKFLANNSHLKPTVTAREIAQKISEQFELANGRLFSKKNQQEAGNIDRVIFEVGKANRFFQIKNTASFNRKYTNKLNEAQMQRAKDLTRKQIETYLNARGIVFKDEPGGSEIRQHVIAKILKNGFIVEDAADGNGIAFRQLRDDYWSLKQFKPEEVIERAMAGMVDTNRTELQALEMEASLREKALRLAHREIDERTGEFKLNHKHASSLFQAMKDQAMTQRVGKRIPTAERFELEQEFLNEFIWREGIIGGTYKDLTLSERQHVDAFVKNRFKDLETPTITTSEGLEEYEARYRNFDNLTGEY